MKLIIKLVLNSIFFLFIIVMSYSCSTNNKKLKNEGLTISKTEDFKTFYDNFIKDSLFQMSRLKFPLKGMNVDGFERVSWTKDNWQLMKAKIFDIDTTQFKVEYLEQDNLFSGRVWLENSGFNIELRFELIETKWYLVYYLNQNL